MRGHGEGRGHYGKKGEWNQIAGSLSFKAKKTVKLSAPEDHLVCVFCLAHVWIISFR